jgi:hypothetical protein
MTVMVSNDINDGMKHIRVYFNTLLTSKFERLK